MSLTDVDPLHDLRIRLNQESLAADEWVDVLRVRFQLPRCAVCGTSIKPGQDAVKSVHNDGEALDTRWVHTDHRGWDPLPPDGEDGSKDA